MRRMKSFRHPSSNKSIEPPDGSVGLCYVIRPLFVRQRRRGCNTSPTGSPNLFQPFGRTLRVSSGQGKRRKVWGNCLNDLTSMPHQRSSSLVRIINKYPAVPPGCLSLISQPQIPKHGIQSSVIKIIKAQSGKMAPRSAVSTQGASLSYSPAKASMYRTRWTIIRSTALSQVRFRIRKVTSLSWGSPSRPCAVLWAEWATRLSLLTIHYLRE
jgi:hypothetical protein